MRFAHVPRTTSGRLCSRLVARGHLALLTVTALSCDASASSGTPPGSVQVEKKVDSAEAQRPPASEDDAPANGERMFGGAWDDSVPEITLSQLLAEPAEHKGERVWVRGEVARVCQAMGCWMELKENAGGRTLRVPMAGHAFFLPKDAVGEKARVQGEVVLQELSAEQQAHYRSEGMEATSTAISLHAQAVRLGGS